MHFEEVSESLKSLGLPSFRAKQVWQWLHQKGVASFDEMTNLSKQLRDTLSDKYVIKFCEVERKSVSALDGTVKYLFRLYDGQFIESVLMKYKYGYSLCVSTQVGCRMNCAFCATGVGGFIRNLSAAEILSQIHAAQNDMDIKVSHIVLMGMGEPMDNYENVIRFLRLVNNDDGLNIGMRNISLSTCGIIPGIKNLQGENLQLTLSVSLHAPNDNIRTKLMPVNKKYPVDELLSACREYADVTSRRISYEYAMFGGVNDSDECAVELAEKLKGTLAHINLIPANDVTESGLKSSTPERIKHFSEILEKAGRNVTVRRSLGGDIDASCGQLRSKHINN
ncbi:MAG: 23S rRNA (adenine(2503)-C(2))-methyltransferase RlmN [Clostridia bacterium]|nr:23S rRNA (adenine(2503)-C(2))-methyltransferase RlmN [Clostridia bacterium]